MNKHGAALDVAEEFVSEAVAFMSAFDEAGNVGNNECLIINADDAEVWNERGERIVGDFRFRGADHRDQRRFARVRQSNDADVGDQLQFNEQLALFTCIARLRKSRRLTSGRREMLVAPPAAPTLRDEHTLALVGEISKHVTRLSVADNRADG